MDPLAKPYGDGKRGRDPHCLVGGANLHEIGCVTSMLITYSR